MLWSSLSSSFSKFVSSPSSTSKTRHYRRHRCWWPKPVIWRGRHVILVMVRIGRLAGIPVLSELCIVLLIVVVVVMLSVVVRSVIVVMILLFIVMTSVVHVHVIVSLGVTLSMWWSVYDIVTTVSSYVPGTSANIANGNCLINCFVLLSFLLLVLLIFLALCMIDLVIKLKYHVLHGSYFFRKFCKFSAFPVFLFFLSVFYLLTFLLYFLPFCL